MFPSPFVADTKVIYGYNFVALLKRFFFTTSIGCKIHANVDTRHIWYKICDDKIAIGYNGDIVLEKKNH